MIRDESTRSLLFDMDMAIIKLSRDHPGHTSVVELTSVYHNLLRQWAELLARFRKSETAREESGAASEYSDNLFRSLGGFLYKAQIDVVLDVDLLLHKSKVMRHIDVAL